MIRDFYKSVFMVTCFFILFSIYVTVTSSPYYLIASDRIKHGDSYSLEYKSWWFDFFNNAIIPLNGNYLVEYVSNGHVNTFIIGHRVKSDDDYYIELIEDSDFLLLKSKDVEIDSKLFLFSSKHNVLIGVDVDQFNDYFFQWFLENYDKNLYSYFIFN